MTMIEINEAELIGFLRADPERKEKGNRTRGIAADVKVLVGDPSTVSRTVQYHETDIIRVATEVQFTTMIELPKQELQSILEVT